MGGSVSMSTTGQLRRASRLERALFAMVAQRACAPASKLACYEQWLAEEVRIEGTEGLALHHLYRVLALLLERMAEAACADTWRNIRHDLKRIKLAQLLSPKGTVWQLTEPPTDPRMHSST